MSEGDQRERMTASPPLSEEADTGKVEDIGGACNPAQREEYLLTVQEFADVARVSTETVRSLCRQRKLRHLRIGQQIRIPSGVLQDFIGGR